ncbi:hypothetical protein ATANTOWER_028882, partial [Ataeniobius toweri]|nr:hypothetical protein [Ataeniobius toweri]
QSLILSMHVATVERKNSLLTGRNLQQNQNQAQCERPSATTHWEFRNDMIKFSMFSSPEHSICFLSLLLVLPTRTDLTHKQTDHSRLVCSDRFWFAWSFLCEKQNRTTRRNYELTN